MELSVVWGVPSTSPKFKLAGAAPFATTASRNELQMVEDQQTLFWYHVFNFESTSRITASLSTIQAAEEHGNGWSREKKTWKRGMTAIALLQNSASNILRKTIWWMRSLSSKPAARSYLWKFSKVLLKKSNRVPTFEIRSPQHVRCVLTLTSFHVR